jgi:hypothetical protein
LRNPRDYHERLRRVGLRGIAHATRTFWKPPRRQNSLPIDCPGTRLTCFSSQFPEESHVTISHAEASCTAGRANFVTGQLSIRTGLITLGQAGAAIGMPAEAPTIANAELKDKIGPRNMLHSWATDKDDSTVGDLQSGSRQGAGDPHSTVTRGAVITA